MGRTSRVSFWCGQDIFLLSNIPIPALGGWVGLIHWASQANSLGVKWPGHETDHSPLPPAMVRDERSYIVFLPCHIIILLTVSYTCITPFVKKNLHFSPVSINRSSFVTWHSNWALHIMFMPKDSWSTPLLPSPTTQLNNVPHSTKTNCSDNDYPVTITAS